MNTILQYPADMLSSVKKALNAACNDDIIDVQRTNLPDFAQVNYYLQSAETPHPCISLIMTGGTISLSFCYAGSDENANSLCAACHEKFLDAIKESVAETTAPYVCGYCCLDGCDSEIMVNPATGEFYFLDVTGVERCILELNLEDPTFCDVTEAAAEIASGMYGDCVGVVYCKSGVVVLDDDTTAHFADREGNPMEGTFTIDMTADYDEEE